MQAYRALQGRFDPHLYPACAAGLDGIQRRSLILTESRSLGPGRYKILDGAHRASLLAGSGRQSVLVADLTRAGQQAVPCPEHETRPPTTRPHTAESKEGQWLAARVQDGLQALKACNVTYTVLKVQDDANFPLGLTAPCDVDILVGSLKRATSCLTAALAETDAPGAAHHMKTYQAGVDGNQQQIDLFDGRGRLMLKLDLHRSLPLVQAVSVKPRWIRSVLVRSLLQLSPLGFTWPRPNMSDDCAIRWLEWFAHRSNPKKQRHRQWAARTAASYSLDASRSATTCSCIHLCETVLFQHGRRHRPSARRKADACAQWTSSYTARAAVAAAPWTLSSSGQEIVAQSRKHWKCHARQPTKLLSSAHRSSNRVVCLLRQGQATPPPCREWRLVPWSTKSLLDASAIRRAAL